MRGLRTLLATAALISFAITAQAQDAVSYYGFSFPSQIGAMERKNVTDFEKTNPGVGYGISYVGDGAFVDIFVYDLGKRSISWDVFHADQREELEASIRAIYRTKEAGRYRDVKDGEEFESPAVKNPFFRCKAFVIEHANGLVRDSVICLGAQNNKFFKARITYAERQSNVAERSDKLMREISRATKF